MNRRSMKTKREILQAVRTLMEEKSFEDITVVDIVDCADISRGTFYLHYEDKYIMLEQLEEQLIQVISGKLDAILVETTDLVEMMTARKTVMLEVLKDLKAEQQTIEVLMRTPAKERIQFRIQAIMEQIFKFTYDQIPQTVNPNMPIALISKIGASIFMTMLDYWLEEKMVSTPEQILMTCFSLIVRGPMQTIGIRLDEDNIKELIESL
jgi:AcrR family transcriptional regulator